MLKYQYLPSAQSNCGLKGCRKTAQGKGNTPKITLPLSEGEYPAGMRGY
jgi:hypothetical protein